MSPGRALFLRRQRNLGDQAKRALRNWRETAGAKGMSAVLKALVQWIVERREGQIARV